MNEPAFDPEPEETPPRLSPGETRRRKGAGVALPQAKIPEHKPAPWLAAPAAARDDVPHCPKCLYFHRPDEECR